MFLEVNKTVFTFFSTVSVAGSIPAGFYLSKWPLKIRDVFISEGKTVVNDGVTLTKVVQIITNNSSTLQGINVPGVSDWNENNEVIKNKNAFHLRIWCRNQLGRNYYLVKKTVIDVLGKVCTITAQS